MDAEQFLWFVGALVGTRTRVCFEDSTGAHPLTPASIRQRYATQTRDSALVVWRSPADGLGGIRAGIDEVTWRDVDINHFKTSFCSPAKGSGYVMLTAHGHDGQTLVVVSSDQYDSAIYQWHVAAAKLVEQAYPGRTQVRDDGYDA